MLPSTIPHCTLHQLQDVVLRFEECAAEEGSAPSFKVMTFYSLLKHLEREGHIDVVNKVGHTKCTRQIVNGRDKVEVLVDGNVYYKIHEDAKNVNWDAPKTIFAENTDTLKTSTLLAIAPRYRYDSVGKNLKLMKPYVVTTRVATLSLIGIKTIRQVCVLGCPLLSCLEAPHKVGLRLKYGPLVGFACLYYPTSCPTVNNHYAALGPRGRGA